MKIIESIKDRLAKRKARKQQERIERQKQIDEYVSHFPDPSESVLAELTPELLVAKYDEIIVNWDEYFLEKNMLHEMIHIAVCQENGENVEPAHGDKFYLDYDPTV